MAGVPEDMKLKTYVSILTTVHDFSFKLVVTDFSNLNMLTDEYIFRPNLRKPNKN